MRKLTAFLRGLEDANIHYMLGYYTISGMESTAAVTVHVTASGDERWEVEFFDDDHVEIERFVSDGGVDDATVDALLDELRADS